MKDFDWWNEASDADRMKEFFALAARLAEAERLLIGHRFCGDQYPVGGWPDINEYFGLQEDAKRLEAEFEAQRLADSAEARLSALKELQQESERMGLYDMEPKP